MTNTYDDDAEDSVKMLEELRCLRCVMERVLRVMDEGLFVDYQMEKFGKKAKSGLLEGIVKVAEGLAVTETVNAIQKMLICPKCGSKNTEDVKSEDAGTPFMPKPMRRCQECQHQYPLMVDDAEGV